MTAPCKAAGTSQERFDAMRARDQRLCRCGHKCVGHGSLDTDGAFVGLGLAGCGITGCDCSQFADSP